MSEYFLQYSVYSKTIHIYTVKKIEKEKQYKHIRVSSCNTVIVHNRGSTTQG